MYTYVPATASALAIEKNIAWGEKAYAQKGENDIS